MLPNASALSPQERLRHAIAANVGIPWGIEDAIHTPIVPDFRRQSAISPSG
jgi:hypothetical protein